MAIPKIKADSKISEWNESRKCSKGVVSSQSKAKAVEVDGNQEEREEEEEA